MNINDSTGVVTIVNNGTDSTIASGTTTTLSTATDIVTENEVPAIHTISDLEAIQTMFDQYFAVLSKGEILTSADLEPFYATNYGINDGMDRAQTINDWARGIPDIITSSNITIDAKGDDYNVDGIMYFVNGTFGRFMFEDGGLVVTKESGAWKLKGNGYKSKIHLYAFTKKNVIGFSFCNLKV